jgi:hypothetical protein
MDDTAARQAAALESAPLAPEKPADADELAVLVPDVEITVGGQKITVRELRFGEQVRHAGALAAIVAAMLPNQKDGKGALFLDALPVCGKELFTLLAVATGQSEAWVEALSSEDGDQLLLAFWETNRRFFGRRLAVLLDAAEIAAALAGAASSPPSSATDTGAAS